MNRFLATKQRRMSVWLILLATVALAQPILSAHADIIPIGDVSPDPSTWGGSTTGYVGNTGSGTLTVNGGSALFSGTGYIGYSTGSVGVVSVDGFGSTWNNSNNLYVGYSGSGTLSITNGGSVSVAGATLVEPEMGTSGMLDFGTSGGTLTTQGQRSLTACSGKDLEHIFIVPTAGAAFHGHAVFLGMLLQQRQGKAIQPSEVFSQSLVADA